MLGWNSFQNGNYFIRVKTKRNISRYKTKKEAKIAKADAPEQIIDRSVLVFNENVCT